MTAIVGIDLGTTNSVIAWIDEAEIVHVIPDADGSRITPSAVFFPQEGGDPIVGRLALEKARGKGAARLATIFKRGMGTPYFAWDPESGVGRDFVVDGKVWRPEELSSLVLKKLAVIAKAHIGSDSLAAVVTVPAYFGAAEREATRRAAELAGLELLSLLEEPTAAALHRRVKRPEAGTILVFDLGGGTFDVTVMHAEPDGSTEVLSKAGDRELGGTDFDDEIIAIIADRIKAETGQDVYEERGWLYAEVRHQAEEIKKELSSAETAQRMIATGSTPLEFTLTRREFEAAIEEDIATVGICVDDALRLADLQPSDIDGVLLVGGSSRIPCMARLVRDKFGREPILTSNPDEDVAIGAAMYAAHKAAEAGEFELDPRGVLGGVESPNDIVTHALGVVAIEDGIERNAVIIERGARLPACARQRFGTNIEGQTSVSVVLLEGELPDPSMCRTLGQASGEFDTPRPRGYPVDVEITFDAEQQILVQAIDGQTGQRIGQMRVAYDGIMSRDQLEDSGRTIGALNPR
jgi:molecular chaperone DnaK